jgi:hypothetical protein
LRIYENKLDGGDALTGTREIQRLIAAHVTILDFDQAWDCLSGSGPVSETEAFMAFGYLDVVAKKLNELGILGCACLQVYLSLTFRRDGQRLSKP